MCLGMCLWCGCWLLLLCWVVSYVVAAALAHCGPWKASDSVTCEQNRHARPRKVGARILSCAPSCTHTRPISKPTITTSPTPTRCLRSAPPSVCRHVVLGVLATLSPSPATPGHAAVRYAKQLQTITALPPPPVPWWELAWLQQCCCHQVCVSN